MSVLFVHDHKFKFDGKHYYSNGGLSQEIIDRYYNKFGFVTILARIVNTNHVDESKLDSSKVKVIDSQNKENFNVILKANHIIIRLPSFNGNRAIRIANKHHKKYITEVVGCAFDSLYYHSFKGKLISPYMFYVTKKYIKHSKWVIYVTKEFLQKRYPTNGRSIACSDVLIQDIDLKQNLTNRLARIENLDDIVIGTIGSLEVRYKGQESVIKAIKKITNHSFIYRLVGSGSSNYIKNLIQKLNLQDCIVIDGVLPHEKIGNWLNQIDIYIQPSYTEGLPRTVIEAMSTGCFVLASNVGGHSELLDKNYIFVKKNIDEIAYILQGIQKEDLKAQAKLNIIKAHEYDRSNLDGIRNLFFDEYLKELSGEQND